jgi:hypothetical protein
VLTGACILDSNDVSINSDYTDCIVSRDIIYMHKYITDGVLLFTVLSRYHTVNTQVGSFYVGLLTYQLCVGKCAIWRISM